MWLWDVERLLWLPNEYTLQQAMLPHSLTTQAANIYYAGAHVPAMGIFLVWLFGRHRDVYPTWRNTLAIVTFLCLTIQLIPLAPPRLTPGLGLIDSGLAYGQSVYGALGRGNAGQYQAMPSIHIAWAALIGWAVFMVSTSRWRWLGAAHFVLTFLVVAATGNHFWLDGIAAMVLLIPAWTVGRRIGVQPSGGSRSRIGRTRHNRGRRVTPRPVTPQPGRLRVLARCSTLFSLVLIGVLTGCTSDSTAGPAATTVPDIDAETARQATETSGGAREIGNPNPSSSPAPLLRSPTGLPTSRNNTLG